MGEQIDRHLLRRLMELRLRVQAEGTVEDDDLREVMGAFSSLDLTNDSPIRRSLVLLLENISRRLWISSKSASFLKNGIERQFVNCVLKKIGSQLEILQFPEHQQWFGGVASAPSSSSSRQNLDKCRIFSIMIVCLALCEKNCEDSEQKPETIWESLMRFYSSTYRLAQDLLNSDDRFLVTVSALLSATSKYCEPVSLQSFAFQLIMAALRGLRFNAKVLLDWIDGDELGLSTVTAIVDYLVTEKILKCEGPPTKRRRLLSEVDDECRTTYLMAKAPPSETDVVVTVRVPFSEDGDKTFRFPREPPVPIRHSLLAPKEDSQEIAALEEMMVELKLLLNQRILDCDDDGRDYGNLIESLIALLDDGSGGEDQSEEDGDDEESEGEVS
ncbi:hypothetical protein Q1695_006362 [Nippostrongylus brasiliensis]|nr:hypothetical protein Q1695_006362 [Nippostrongylus brasiliensis]